MSDKMKWPMPVPPQGYTCWEFWRSFIHTDLHLIPKEEEVVEGNIELTQEVWDALPEETQEAFFKLSLLEEGTTLEGVGLKDNIGWLDLDVQVKPTMVAGVPFEDWYKNLPRVEVLR
jgi:hypothetical protein